MIRIFILKMRLRYYGIKEYIINDDMSIDVNGNVNLSNKRLCKIPFDFRNVYGNFNIAHNKLKSLKGSPNIVGGDFICFNNKLSSLEGSPKEVGNHFHCQWNELISLEGSPDRIGGNFYCQYNQLTSLEGYPNRIGGNFYCINNPIYSIYKLFNDPSQIELFNDYDIIRDNGQSIVLDRLNAFLDEIGKSPVDSVNGYKNVVNTIS